MSVPRRRRRRPAVVALACVIAACAGSSPPATTALPEAPPRRSSRPDALPLPPREVQRMLESDRFALREVKRAEAGVMGVSKALAHFPDRGVDLEIKWAPAPHRTLDEWDGSPRKELAAFAVQRWFLDPDDWVVPPTTMRCLPPSAYPPSTPVPEPTVAGTQCVLGLVAAWLEHVEPAQTVYDPERFRADPAYAGHVADFNTLTYLVDHRDGRSSNILVSDDPVGRRVYAIDNGISFGNVVYNYFVPNWNVIRVPALRRDVIARLRRVTSDDVAALRVVAELRADRRGILRAVRRGRALDPDEGVRIDGRVVQLGLTAAEADAVASRLRDLLARVDAGEIRVF